MEVVFSSCFWTSCATWVFILVGVNNKSLLVVWLSKEKTYTTRENDASEIFQRITLLWVSQATSKVIVRTFFINLWITWHKYIIGTTSIHLYIYIYIFDSVVKVKSKSIFHFKRTQKNTPFESFANPLASFRPVGIFARFTIFTIIDTLL